jgi:acyl carrier protein
MISQSLKNVILRVLHLEDFDFKDSTTAAEVPGWDSLKHVAILTAVEQEFAIRFRSMEVIRLKNVGELQALVDRKAPDRTAPPV